MTTKNLLTENATIDFLVSYLEVNGWEIIDKKYGNSHGYDIEAIRYDETLIVEVKGAMANEGSKIKKRPFFDSGQIKTHLGKAIVKVLEVRNERPEAIIAIAHPYTPSIVKIVTPLLPYLVVLGIEHFWVKENGEVTDKHSF